MMRLKEKYEKEVVGKMMQEFGFKNKMAVPRLEKVVLNIGFGKLISGKTSQEKKKIVDSILHDIALIAGQKPVITKARKSISGFRLRKGEGVGAKVTLRRGMMYDFLERLIHIALPRSRDFRGIDEKSFDKKGNLTVAIKEHIAFPEIMPEEISSILSLEVTVVTNAKKRDKSIALFKFLGFPIKKK